MDRRGDAAITGSFNNTVDFGGPVLVSRGANLPRYGDAFLLKLRSPGAHQVGRQIGGTGSDGGDEVAIGPHRNIYVIGDANGPVTFTPSVTLRPPAGATPGPPATAPTATSSGRARSAAPASSRAMGSAPTTTARRS